MGTDAFTARAEARRRDVLAHRGIRIRGRKTVIRDFDPQHLLRGAGALQHRAAVRAHARGAVADLNLRELHLLFVVRDAPNRVFFFNGVFKGLHDLRFEFEQFVIVAAAHVDFGFAVTGDGVHRRTAGNLADRKRSLRVGRHLDVRNLGPSDAGRVNGARGLAEVSVRVTGRAVHHHAPTVRTYGTAQYAAHVRAVDCDEAVDGVIRRHVLRTADVAVAFFAHGAHKPDVAFSFNLLIVEAAQDLQQSSEPRHIVSDAGRAVNVAFFLNGDVGSGGENAVHMGAQGENGAVTLPGTLTDDIADFVDRDVGEAVGLHAFGDRLRAFRFRKRRGRNFAEFDLFGHRAIHFLFSLFQRCRHLGERFEGFKRRHHGRFNRRNGHCHFNSFQIRTPVDRTGASS